MTEAIRSFAADARHDLTYHKPSRFFVVALAAMSVWIVLGFASLWPSLRWLEFAFGGVSGTGSTLAAAVQGAVMIAAILGLLALFGKYRRV